jgi:hypothetical protein
MIKQSDWRVEVGFWHGSEALSIYSIDDFLKLPSYVIEHGEHLDFWREIKNRKKKCRTKDLALICLKRRKRVRGSSS